MGSEMTAQTRRFTAYARRSRSIGRSVTTNAIGSRSSPPRINAKPRMVGRSPSAVSRLRTTAMSSQIDGRMMATGRKSRSPTSAER